MSKVQRFEDEGRVPVLAWMDGVEFDTGPIRTFRFYGPTEDVVDGRHFPPLLIKQN